MKTAAIVGILLIALGVLGLSYQSITFFTTERTDVGPFSIAWDKPHTIVFHPVLGVVALVVGAMLLMSGRKAMP